MKRFANKKVRSNTDIPNGKAYTKVSESWDICDYITVYTENEHYLWCKKVYPNLTDKEIKARWYSIYKSK